MNTDPRLQEGFEAGVKGAIWRGKAPELEADSRRGPLFRRCPECGAFNPGSVRYCQVDGVDLRDVVLATASVLETEVGHAALPIEESVEDHSDIAGRDILPNPQEMVSEPRHTARRTSVWIGFVGVMVTLAVLSLMDAPSRPDAVLVQATARQLPTGDSAHRDSGKERPLNASMPEKRVRQSPSLETSALAAMDQPRASVAADPEDWSTLPPAPVPPVATMEISQDVLADTLQTEGNADVSPTGFQEPGEALRQELIRELRAHGFGNFKVTVSRHRVVTLKGVSDDPLVKESALMLARKHPAVTRVRDKIFLVGD